MGWLFVPGLADSNSASDSPSLDTDVWVQSSGTPKQRPFSLALKSRAVMRILSGTISRPFRASAIAIESLSFLPVFPVSPSVMPDSSKARTMSDGSGLWSPDTFALFDRDSCSWNAPLDMFGTALAIRSETWPSSGSMRSGACSQTKLAAHRIGVSGSSFSRGEYPTPAASRYGKNQGGGSGAGTGEARPSLETWAKSWATPTSRDWKDGANPSEESETNALLGRQAPRWPTATDARSSGSAGYSTKSGHREGTTLTDATVRGYGPQAHRTSPDGETTPGPSRLSPRFVEALMGLPPGLASCTLSATPFRQWLQRWHCELLRIVGD